MVLQNKEEESYLHNYLKISSDLPAKDLSYTLGPTPWIGYQRTPQVPGNINNLKNQH